MAASMAPLGDEQLLCSWLLQRVMSSAAGHPLPVLERFSTAGATRQCIRGWHTHCHVVVGGALLKVSNAQVLVGRCRWSTPATVPGQVGPWGPE